MVNNASNNQEKRAYNLPLPYTLYLGLLEVQKPLIFSFVPLTNLPSNYDGLHGLLNEYYLGLAQIGNHT